MALILTSLLVQLECGPSPLQAYLLDWDFDLNNGQLWKRTGYGGVWRHS